MDVRRSLRTCQVCQATIPNNVASPGLLQHCMFVSEKVWYHISMDFIISLSLMAKV